MLLTLDGLTIVLLLVLLLLLTIVILLRPPPPPAHPFLLGRQSIPSRTRLQHESPIYTNNASGGLRAPLRPGKLRTLGELVSSSDSKLGSSDGALAEGGGEQIKDLVLALKEGIQSALGSAEGAVAVLVENPTGSLFFVLSFPAFTAPNFHSGSNRFSSPHVGPRSHVQSQANRLFSWVCDSDIAPAAGSHCLLFGVPVTGRLIVDICPCLLGGRRWSNCYKRLVGDWESGFRRKPHQDQDRSSDSRCQVHSPHTSLRWDPFGVFSRR